MEHQLCGRYWSHECGDASQRPLYADVTVNQCPVALISQGWDLAERYMPGMRAAMEAAGAIRFNIITEGKEVRHHALCERVSGPLHCARSSIGSLC